MAAAVSNAGGLGVVGGLGWTPKFMKEELRQLKEQLNDPNLPFGVDLALPKVSNLFHNHIILSPQVHLLPTVC